MSRFPTPQALVSWAGLTPTARQSAAPPAKGQREEGANGPTPTPSSRIAVLAALRPPRNTRSSPGERFRRLSRPRPGGGGREGRLRL